MFIWLQLILPLCFVCEYCFLLSVPPESLNLSVFVKSQTQQDESRLLFKLPHHYILYSLTSSVYLITPSLLWSVYARTHISLQRFLHTLIIHLNSHFTGCKLWSLHPVSFFYEFVELGIHRHTGIRTVSYIQHRDSVTLHKSENTHTHTQPDKYTHSRWIDIPSEKISQSKMP